jgi:putative FmdB family regulatory protein
MILYEYRCLRCRTLFTARMPMECCNQPATCPECGAAGRRVISKPQAKLDAWSRPEHPEKLRTTREIWE